MIDQQKIREAVGSLILAIGEDPTREGLVETPRRVAQMYEELFSGMDEDPSIVLATGYEEDHRDMVLLKDISFTSICEHHFLPFFGTAGIGYVPNGRVVGASKLVRALDILSRRPQLQERLTMQLAEVILSSVQAQGVAVMLSAEHMCISCRGVKKPGSRVVTTASLGTIRTHEATRREMYSLLNEA